MLLPGKYSEVRMKQKEKYEVKLQLFHTPKVEKPYPSALLILQQLLLDGTKCSFKGVAAFLKTNFDYLTLSYFEH